MQLRQQPPGGPCGSRWRPDGDLRRARGRVSRDCIRDGRGRERPCWDGRMLLLWSLWFAASCAGGMGSAQGRAAGGKRVCESRAVGLHGRVARRAGRTGRKIAVAPPLTATGSLTIHRRSLADPASSARAAPEAARGSHGLSGPPRRDLQHRSVP